ncbi:MAG TPA: flagellar hook-associated protein FlgK [Rugosimonospora sp.]|nr:flagellar hook-associated protein FlgK [Rugosimonospora sp.]
MESTFAGLNIALTSLYAQKRGLDVTGQNIANANTDGYTRQRVLMRSLGAPPVGALYSVDAGSGGGVEVSGVSRMQDDLLISRARTEHAQDSYLTGVNTTYGQLEQVFNEPSDTGLQEQLGQFWSDLHDLANNPGDLATRSTVLQQAQVVAGDLNSAHTTMASIWSTTRQTLDSRLIEVNNTADTVAQLNAAIRASYQSGTPANNLIDQRDQGVLRLSELTGATALSRPDGTVDVYLSGSGLVSGSLSRHLQATGATRLEDQGVTPVAIQWTDNQTSASVTGGEVAADMQSLGQVLPANSAALDQVATSLMSQFNTQHQAGYDQNGNPGTAMFTGTGAADIAVAITDPRLIAASGTASTGGNLDGSNATALAGLANAANGPDVNYRQMIANLGVQSQSAARRVSIQDSLKQQVDDALSAQSGVNLDEEMTNMLAYQRAYEAASRVMTAVDSTLDTLINHTGLG